MTSYQSQQTSFSETLYARAADYFESQSGGHYANPIFYIKGLCLIAFFILAYIRFVFFTTEFSELLFWAVVLGICQVFIPINLAHDAIHRAVSSKRWINEIALLGFDLTGGNSYMYRKKHLEAHANKENGSKKAAIESQGLIMQKIGQESKKNLHFSLYLFYSIYMIFIRDFILFMDKSEKHPFPEILKLIIFKVVYFIIFLVLPFIYIPQVWLSILTAIFLMYLSITVVLVIILLMPTEKMENSRNQKEGEANDQWLIEVLTHNVDFSPKSRSLNLIAGGANLNVVHYIFPNVNHVHYNALAQIIKTTAEEFGTNYREQNVRDVFGIHFNYIRHIQDTESRSV